MQFLLLAVLAGLVATGRATCPNWTLPWDTYTGAINDNNVCVYSDVRFASPPTKALRFQAPKYPPVSADGAAPSSAMSCIQVNTQQGVGEVLPPPRSAEGDPQSYGYQDEDCLFLDVYIPPAAFGYKDPITVVNWIYGGAYFLGSKTYFNTSVIPFYSGDAFVNTAANNAPIIFVAGNYRLGAFGWLAGEYMQAHGQPNAGLLDQRTVQQFIHDHLPSLGGESPLSLGSVSVWGESAGASSIMHHLAMPLNIDQPLFQRALLQSPAYQWMWDTSVMDETYVNFAKNVTANVNGSCADSSDMACLQAADVTDLINANQGLFQQYLDQGFFPVGPSVDGNLIPSLAPTRFVANPANNSDPSVLPIDSIMVSHVDEEIHPTLDATAKSFIPRKIRANPTDETILESFVTSIFHDPDIVSDILNQYPNSSFKNQVDRATSIIVDSSFTCHTRFIIEHYLSESTPVYAMDYAVFTKEHAAVHASDLIPTFANAHTDYTDFIRARLKIPLLPSIINKFLTKKVGPKMQTFFTGHAISGDPNQKVVFPESKWFPAKIKTCPKGTSGTCVWFLMKPRYATFAFSDNTGADIQTSSDRCGFWSGLAEKLTPTTGKAGDDLKTTSEQVPLHVDMDL